MFDFPKKLAFGLDLSDRSLKIVQFKKQKGGLSLSGFTAQDIPSGLVQNGEIKKEKELTSVLKNVLTEARKKKIIGNRVVCNLPEEKVFIRVIQLPQMKEEEIAQAVYWETEAHIPLSIDEVYMDWQIIEPVVNHLNHIDILIAAAPRDLVNSYLNLLKRSGLQPVALEPESVAVVRSLIKLKDHKPAVIVDLGLTGTNCVVFAARAIRFTSHTPVSGQLFTETIAQDLKVSGEEANQLKIKVGLDKTKKEGKVYQSLEPIINDLAKRIGEYINFYSNNTAHIHSKEKKIEQVILCGGDSLLINLPFELEKKLKLPVKLGNPLEGVLPFSRKNKSSANKIVFPRKEIFSYNTAIGLALNENDQT